MTTIPEAVAFNEATAALDAAQKISRDLDLDVGIAERNLRTEADQPAVAAAKKARQDHTTEVWYPAYRGQKAAAKALADALGVDPRQLGEALR